MRNLACDNEWKEAVRQILADAWRLLGGSALGMPYPSAGVAPAPAARPRQPLLPGWRDHDAGFAATRRKIKRRNR